MKRGVFPIAAVLLIAVLSACSQDSGLKSSSLTVSGVVPPPGEEFDGRLTVVFNQPIRQDDPTSTPLLFDTPVSGKFLVGANYVSFVPDYVRKNQVVEGRVSPSIRSAKTGAAAEPTTVCLTSFQFKPDLFFPIDRLTTSTLFGLQFTAPVQLQSIQQHLNLTGPGGKPMPYKIVPSTDLAIVRLLTEPTTAALTLKVSAGVAEIQNRFQTHHDAEFSISAVETPRPEPLRVYGASWAGVDRNRQQIAITFNKRLKPEVIRDKLVLTDVSTTVTRPLAFKVVRSDNDSVVIELSAPNPMDIKVHLSLPAGVEAADGTALPEAWNVDTANRTQLRLEYSNWDSDEDKGLALQLNFTSPIRIEDFKKHFTIQPPLTAMQITQSGESTYVIYGDYSTDTPYQITLTKGLAFASWAELTSALPIVVTSPERLPTWIGFPELDRYYFPRRFGNTVPVQSRGEKVFTARLSRMFPNNIAVALGDLSANNYSSTTIEGWSEQVGEAKIQVKGRMNQLVTTPIEIDKLTTAPLKGVYCLQVETEQYRRSRIVLLTDLGALAHWQAGEATIFVHNLFTLAPVPQARVQVYSTKNQLLGEAVTDAQGIARLNNLSAAKGDAKVAVITAGSDYTFVVLENRDYPAEMRGVSTSYNAKAYDGFIYADRDLYRPGDTVHLRWIVRQNYGDALSSAPLVLKINAPNGRTALERTVALSKIGTAGLDFTTLDSYATGSYTVSLSVPGSQSSIGSYRFQIEEFVPLRMKAELTPPAAPWVERGENFTLLVRGRHLTGQPAQDRTAEGEIQFTRGFDFKNWPEYRFGNDESKYIAPIRLGQQTTNEEGVATFAFKTGEAAQATSPLRAHIVGRIFELGGRAVRASADTVYFPSPICLGIKAEPGQGEDEVAVSLAALAPDGNATTTLNKVQVTLERETYNYYVRRMYTHHEAQWSERFEKIDARDVALTSGTGKVTFHVTNYGFYRLKVAAPETRQFSTIGFYAWGGKPRVERESQPSLIKLKLDRAEVAAGESAKLRIDSAFDGKGVVVIQGEHIYRLVPIEIKGGSAVLDVPADLSYAPNVWLEVTVIHAVEKGRRQLYPFSSFAALPLAVRDPARRIDVAIANLPTEVLPGTRLPLAIQTRNARGQGIAAEVTVAAVDEGIHLLSGYKSPDPARWFGRMRSPDFNRAHYYDKIAPDFNAPAAGGDGVGPERLGRPARTWIRTVALWTGRLTTNADGAASISLEIPTYFNGQLRLVAVAADAHASGAREDHLFVRRPWMLETSLPRFMLPGDTATALATVYNSTASSGTVRVAWSTSGTLTLIEPTSSTTQTVGPKSEATVTFDIKAGRAVGQGEVLWRAEVLTPDGHETSTLTEQAYLPVTEPAAYQSRRTLSVLAPGKTATFDTAGFMQDDWTGLAITVGADPLLRLEKALQSVVGYPYGCVEQTTSKLLSLYLLRKNTALVGNLDRKIGPLDIYLRHGIDRLLAMQTGSGGLAYWPGSDDPYPYGSVYGLHFLTLVRNGRELPVDQNNYEILRRYVRKLVTETRGDDFSDYYLRAYATYVLALAGDPEAPSLTEWFRLLELPRSGRWLLAAAIAVATHDTDRVKGYLSAANTTLYSSREQDGTLNSPIRNEAVELMSLVTIKGNAAEMHKRADDLTQWLQTEHWGTTQENAFVIAALCQYLDTVTSGASQARATIQINDAQTSSVTGRNVFRKTVKGPNARFKVTNAGNYNLYMTAVASGIPNDAQTTPVTQGMAISRRILGRDGNEVKPGELRQGGNYVVELTIHCDRETRNVVVTDLLPAGFEIDNPRLNQNERTGIVLPHATMQPMHLEIRDERLVLVFNTLPSTPYNDKHYFYYLVNAVTPGKFQHPPVTAEAMYDPSVRATSAPEVVEVKR